MQWIGIVLEAIRPEILSIEWVRRAKALDQVQGVSCSPIFQEVADENRDSVR